MVSTRAGRHILWPSYFDIARSRAEGRRVPRMLAVQDPTSEEILSAASGLGLKASLQEGKAYPANWQAHEGCVSVDKSMRKEDLIAKVARSLKTARQAAQAKQG